MAYNGYVMKIGAVEFNNPSPRNEGGYKFAKELVQVGDSKVLASGKLSTKVLPHTRRKIWLNFPPMTREQYHTYWNALHSDSGGDGMFLSVTAYDQDTDSYITDTYYHSDLETTMVIADGKRMVQIEPFELVGH